MCIFPRSKVRLSYMSTFRQIKTGCKPGTTWPGGETPEKPGISACPERPAESFPHTVLVTNGVRRQGTVWPRGVLSSGQGGEAVFPCPRARGRGREVIYAVCKTTLSAWTIAKGMCNVYARLWSSSSLLPSGPTASRPSRDRVFPVGQKSSDPKNWQTRRFGWVNLQPQATIAISINSFVNRVNTAAKRTWHLLRVWTDLLRIKYTKCKAYI